MIDFFAGTGAFSYAFNEVGIETILANDFDVNSKKIYDANYSHKLKRCDIDDIELENKSECVVVTAGFPCQPFSVAGKARGFDDERSNAFFVLMRHINAIRPKVLLFENVRNLVTHDGGDTFKIIKNKIKEAGYSIKYKVLDTCSVTSVPQHRERIYIVGCLKDECNDFDEFNFAFEDTELKPLTEFLKRDIPVKYYYTSRFACYPVLSNEVTKYIGKGYMYQYRRYYVRRSKKGICPTLTANMGSGGHNVPLIRDTGGIRKLMPRECFNLQGFPNDYILPNTMSDSSLYHLAGNAVSIPVVKKLAKKIKTLV